MYQTPSIAFNLPVIVTLAASKLFTFILIASKLTILATSTSKLVIFSAGKFSTFEPSIVPLSLVIASIVLFLASFSFVILQKLM